MPRLQMRVKRNGKWLYWENMQSLSEEEVASGFDVGLMGVVQYRILDMEPASVQLQVHTDCTPPIEWHDVLFVNGEIELPSCLYSRKIRIKPPEPVFQPGYYRKKSDPRTVIRFDTAAEMDAFSAFTPLNDWEPVDVIRKPLPMIKNDAKRTGELDL